MPDPAAQFPSAPAPTAAQLTASQPGTNVLNLEPSNALVTIDLGRFKGFAMAGVTGLLRMVGAALVAHGMATQGTVNSNLQPVAEWIVGALMAAGGQAWAWFREHEKNNKIVQAANAHQNLVVVTGGAPTGPAA